jgi:peptide/nickel transport system substrate-binding protein
MSDERRERTVSKHSVFNCYRFSGPTGVAQKAFVFPIRTHTLEFRKALILGVDWNAVVNAFYPPEVGERQRGGAPLFSRVTLGYDPELPPYPYNPQEARQLLKASGYKGEKITFWNFFFTANPEQLEVNEVIASYWRALGLEIDLVTIDYGAFRSRTQSRPQKFDPPRPLACNFPGRVHPS